MRSDITEKRKENMAAAKEGKEPVRFNLLFAREAEKLAGCNEGVKQIEAAENPADMADCFLSKIDFCLAKNFPDKELLKEHYRTALEEKGVYIDREVRLQNEKAVEKVNGVFLGDCDAEVAAGRFAVSRLYVKHTGRLKVTACDHAFVMIDALDDARVEVSAGTDTRVCVNLYARATVSVTGTGRVRVIHKNKETYELHN